MVQADHDGGGRAGGSVSCVGLSVGPRGGANITVAALLAFETELGRGFEEPLCMLKSIGFRQVCFWVRQKRYETLWQGRLLQ